MSLIVKENQTVVNAPLSKLPNAGDDHQLPENPLVIIEPKKGWIPLNLSDLWQYRDLLYILTMRDIKVRYKQTALGAAWAILQPLLTMVIFSLLFGKLAGMPSDGIPYPIFAFAGLLPWTFFANALTNSGNSLVGNANLITKVYFPRILIPASSVTAGLVDFFVAFCLLIVLMIYYGIGFSLNLLLLPFLVILTALLAIGLGTWLSALNVKYRDIRHALPFLIQIGLFATPIIYPSSQVPEKWRWLLWFNPLAGQIEAYRAVFFGTMINWLSLGISIALTFIIVIYSMFIFRRMEKSFADII